MNKIEDAILHKMSGLKKKLSESESFIDIDINIENIRPVFPFNATCIAINVYLLRKSYTRISNRKNYYDI